MIARFFRALRAQFSPAALRRVAVTLVVGFSGGALFAALGMPAPWLSGSGLAAAIASVAGVKVEVPTWLKGVALVLLGIIAGSAVTPESVAQMVRWPSSLIGLAICVFLIMTSVSLYLERVHGYDRATARLSSVPGALPYVLALAAESEAADERRVAIIQLVRLAALVIFLPSLLSLSGLESPEVGLVPKLDAPLADLALMAASGAAAGWAFSRFGVPAAWLFGPMIGAALVTGSGFAQNNLPDWLTIPGLMVMGTMVGANFADIDRGMLKDTVLASLGSVMVGAAVGVVCAMPVAWLLDLPLAQVWLAYAPGGVETMAVMALALGLDVAYVGGHHAARFVGLGIVVPIWLRAELKRRSTG